MSSTISQETLKAIKDLKLGQLFTLKLKNCSSERGYFSVFQADAKNNPTSLTPEKLAWIVKPCKANGTVTMQWTVEYSLIWGMLGPMPESVPIPSEPFAPTEDEPLSQLTGGLSPTVDIANGEVYKFIRKGQSYTFDEVSPVRGERLTIGVNASGIIEADNVMIGMAVSGKAVQYEIMGTNSHVTFKPFPNYYVCFDSNLIIEGTPLSETALRSAIPLMEFVYCYELSYNWTGRSQWIQNKKAFPEMVVKGQ